MTYSTYKKGPTAKGIVTLIAAPILLGAGILYGLGAAANSVTSAVSGDSSSTSVAKDYSDLSYEDKVKFMDQAWDSMKEQDKARIVGDDIGVKVTDLYKTIEDKIR